MAIAIALVLAILWGIACGIVIPNPYVSFTLSLVGGFAIGWFVPSLFG